ncbi:hypothetical protein C8T65DRAFT_746921 [Cerioporus squamosus]|nr:hypothetical protein C8T65DRAFT_746921 [Cerioporus squamosus]
MESILLSSCSVPSKRGRSYSPSAESATRRVRIVSPTPSSRSPSESPRSPVSAGEGYATSPVHMPLSVDNLFNSQDSSSPLHIPLPISEQLESPDSYPPTPPLRILPSIGEIVSEVSGSPDSYLPTLPFRVLPPIGEVVGEVSGSPDSYPPTPPFRELPFVGEVGGEVSNSPDSCHPPTPPLHMPPLIGEVSDSPDSYPPTPPLRMLPPIGAVPESPESPTSEIQAIFAEDIITYWRADVGPPNDSNLSANASSDSNRQNSASPNSIQEPMQTVVTAVGEMRASILGAMPPYWRLYNALLVTRGSQSCHCYDKKKGTKL